MAQNSTRIHQPLDEQDFERACVVLFRGLLRDPNTERIGRRGQDQDGVDIYGLRNEDPAHPVGIQCKAKGPGKKLTEAEVRREVNLAIGFEPKLSEYFIVTTAPDDAAMQRLARVITAEQVSNGQPLRVTIWGWGNLEERIALDPDAVDAFDPSCMDTRYRKRLSPAQHCWNGWSVWRGDCITGTICLIAWPRHTVIRQPLSMTPTSQ